MSSEERVGKVEKRVKTIEEAITLLSNLLESHDDRLEDSVKDNENLEAKIAALIDAQIRTEDKMVELVEAQARSDTKMTNLEDKMAVLAEAQAVGESRLQNINDALDKLTELVKTAHQRIDRLEN